MQSPTEGEAGGGLSEAAAASRIQSMARGQLARKAVKDQRLWEAWNELDWVRYDRACTHISIRAHATL
jgi:hypothetical protein